MMSLRIRAVGLTLLLAPSLSAQSDAQLRPYVDALLAKVSAQGLPRGDTLVEFAKQGPILFFVVGGRPDDVTSSMVRNDGLVGTASSQWTSGRLTAFNVRWATAGAVQADIRGEVRGGTLLLRGARSAQLTLPTLPWGVADYAMEDQLVPLFLSLKLDSTQSIAVWRPFGQKWDTLSVRFRHVETVTQARENM
jgi:hypothetical protein